MPKHQADQAHTFMHAIEFTAEALGDLQALRKFEQKAVLNGLEAQLQSAPTVEIRNRKRLRPNPVADWELRIGRFRVFYKVDIDRQRVSIEAIGFKIGSQLFVRGKETNL